MCEVHEVNEVFIVKVGVQLVKYKISPNKAQMSGGVSKPGGARSIY